MKINDIILKMIVFVGQEYRGQFTPLGTGFLGGVKFDEAVFIFLVTANHVVDSILGDEIFVRINRHTGGCETISIPKTQRMQHGDISNDVAIFCIAIDAATHDFRAMGLSRQELEGSRKRNLPGLGDEVVTVGLYTSHYGHAKNIPVVRVGHIASLPDEPVRTEFGYVAAYLIETKSIAGLSGSPVFLSLPDIRLSQGQLMAVVEKSHPLIGVLVGYHVVESKEDQISVPQFQQSAGARAASADRGIDERNTGFAVVIPIERVLDILEEPLNVAGMRDAIASMEASKL